jgi:hypothetical protein
MYELLAGGALFGGTKEQQMLTRITDMLGPLRWEASGTIPAASSLKQCGLFFPFHFHLFTLLHIFLKSVLIYI